jgi:hypothetical protein
MLTTVCQRWVRRCARFVPPNTRFDRRRYEVAPFADDRRVKAFVETHHYSGTVPPMRWRFGLFERAELVGCAVFSVPAQDTVLAPFDPDAATDLGAACEEPRLGVERHVVVLVSAQIGYGLGQ